LPVSTVCVTETLQVTQGCLLLENQALLDGYRRISIDQRVIEVPKVEAREEVDLRLVPDLAKHVLEIRIWFQDKMVHSVNLPLHEFQLFA
jgi:hypothetical protein